MNEYRFEYAGIFFSIDAESKEEAKKKLSEDRIALDSWSGSMEENPGFKHIYGVTIDHRGKKPSLSASGPSLRR